MQICKTDKQGRISLKRKTFFYSQYYTIEQLANGTIILRPLDNMKQVHEEDEY